MKNSLIYLKAIVFHTVLVCVHAHTCVCRCTFMTMHMKAREKLQLLILRCCLSLYLFFFETRSLAVLDVTKVARTPSHPIPMIFRSWPP